MQSSRPFIALRKTLVGVFVSFSLLYSANATVARAQAVSPGIVLVPGTVTLSDGMNNAIAAALADAAGLFPNTTYFAVTDSRQAGRWMVVSVVGLSQLHAGNTWSIDDGAWIGIVLLHQSQSGAWHGATQGTKAFSSLMATVPDSFLSSTARHDLDPLQPADLQSQSTSDYIFPLAPGTLMNYGSLGVHNNGFTSVVSGWKAVDLMSDGDTTLNHAPNRLIVSEAGTISYVCDDGTSLAVKVGDFFYTHLLYNTSLVVGHVFNKGDYMGKLKTGSFNKTCGYASQPSNWFHVHWGFPNANLQIEDWTLSMATGNWTNGTSTVTPGNWMLAGPTPPMPANLIETSATQTLINFAWDSSTGADGYHIYSWNGTAYVLQDTVPSEQTTYMEMRSTCGWSQTYKVAAYNYIGDSPRASLQATTIPCDPSPLSPANGSTNAWNYDVTFQSSPASGASGYLMEYWGGPYTTPQTCGWSSTSSCHVGILPPGSTYSWHVKARSSAGETNWSPTWTFTILPLPCYTLTVSHTGSGDDPLASPLNSTGCTVGQYHPTDTISFTAAPDTGWKVANWSGTDSNASTSITNTLTMLDGNCTTAVNYTPIVPGVPVLVSPLNGSVKQPINLTLSWNAADGAISYDYCVSTSTSCATWTTNGTNTSAALTNLSLGTTYYWWVRDTNIYGNSSISARWSFTTGSKPGSFSKSSPASGATGQPATTLLQWAASRDAAEYQYCIDRVNDGACQGDNWVSTGTARSADLSGTLTLQTTYYWQVRAINSFGLRYADGGWWSFTTSGIPGSFVKKAPANAAVNVPVRPALGWSASLYATGYEYCIDQTNDSACDGNNWIRIPARTSITPSLVLQPLTTYYWHVHALNGFGMATSNGDAWWSFTTGLPPAAFGKIGPLDGVTDRRLRLTLSWQTSAGAMAYQYCVSTARGSCGSWINTGTGTSVNLTGLAAHTTYYWQARATNPIGITPSDAGIWWSFTTGYLPGAFAKATPVNGATGVALSPTLKWNASPYATTYDYCLSTTTTCTTWVNVGNVTSKAITGLKAGTLYYWQVRARNLIGTTVAGNLWSFRTGVIPGVFSKSLPSNGSLNQPVAVTLSWTASTGAANYQYCIDTINNNACDSQKWISVGLNRSVDLTSLGLSPSTVYYWHVRAVNSFGIRGSNMGVWWSFTTAP